MDPQTQGLISLNRRNDLTGTCMSVKISGRHIVNSLTANWPRRPPRLVDEAPSTSSQGNPYVSATPVLFTRSASPPHRAAPMVPNLTQVITTVLPLGRVSLTFPCSPPIVRGRVQGRPRVHHIEIDQARLEFTHP